MTYQFGETDADDAITGISVSGRGLVGKSEKEQGVWGESSAADRSGVVGMSEKGAGVTGESKDDNPGVVGRSEKGQGVWGVAKAADRSGVVGTSEKGAGVTGESKDDNPGVIGKSEKGQGVWGVARAANRSGVVGTGEKGAGVTGESKADFGGVVGRSEKGFGVWGEAIATDRSGVIGISEKGVGVTGVSKRADRAGIHGKGPGLAGFFEGDVNVTGVLNCEKDVCLPGADLAEQFDVVGSVPAQPGFVMVIAGDNAVRVSDTPYDRRVAGVVSGAGNYRPAIVLDNRPDSGSRQALALSGKVWVMVDADQGEIEIGDLLTTSSRPGHAMKVSDPGLAFGAVIGKALHPLKEGQGLIPILVALQ